MAGVLKLADYLELVARRRWCPGDLDCCTFMADWLMSRGWPDPMSDRRGTYRDRPTFRRMLKSEGGIIESCSTRFSAIGLSRTNSPSAGDVALVQAPFAVRRGRVLRRPIGAICVSKDAVAVVTPDAGMVVSAIPIVNAWAVNG